MKCEICHKELATALINCKEVCQVCFIRLKEELNGKSSKTLKIAQYWKKWITMSEGIVKGGK